MSRSHYDVIVVGVGGMGAAALAHLAARGLSVVGVERDVVPSASGSSVGETRVIRKAYFEDARYVPVIERAYALWHELERRAGQPLLFRTGCLTFGAADHPAVVGAVETARRYGLAHALLDASEIRRRFPAFVPSPADAGVFEDVGGVLRVEACTAAHVRWATEIGATLHVRTRVASFDHDDRGVRVALDDGRIVSAHHAVVAAGAWSAHDPALAKVTGGLPLVVERQVQAFFRPRDASIARAPHFPVFIHVAGDEAFYGIPLHGEEGHEPAVKVCRHHGGATTTADDVDRVVRDADVDDVRAFLRRHMPTIDGPLLRSRVCMYTNTPDGHFVVGRHPRAPRVVVLAGFSGHGYKMASALGEAAADLVVTGRTRVDTSLFDPSRFLAQNGAGVTA